MHRGHQPGRWPGVPPKCSTHCQYLFFFLRSRENSLVFFLWGWTGCGGLHLGEMWGVGLACPHPPSATPNKGVEQRSNVSPNTQGL